MKIEIEISDEDGALLREALARAENPSETGGFNSHGDLTLEGLGAMLLEDAVLAVRRPGSWEGAHMRNLIRAHGYVLPICCRDRPRVSE